MIEANIRDLNDAEIEECENRAIETAHEFYHGYDDALAHHLKIARDSLQQSFESPC